LFIASSSDALRSPPSFPTRRSSDLEPALVRWNMDKRYLTALAEAGIPGVPTSWHDEEASLADALQEAARRAAGSGAADPSATHRSEEHTSELQSRFDLVCRLLLETK